MPDPQCANEPQLVRCGCEEARGFIRPQHPGRVGIKGHRHGGATRGARILQRAHEHGAMPQMNAVKDSNREKERPGQSGQIRDGAQEHWEKIRRQE